MRLNVVGTRPTLTAQVEGECAICAGRRYQDTGEEGMVQPCQGCAAFFERARCFDRARIPFACLGADPARMQPPQDPDDHYSYQLAVAAMHQVVKQASGLVTLAGEKGTGKTWLVCGLLREVTLEHGRSGLYVNARDAIGMLSSLRIQTNGEPSNDQILQAMRMLREVPLLVLDEVGHQRVPFAREIVGHTICGRIDDGRPTFCATNFAEKDIATIFGESVTDRLFRGGMAYYFAGGTRR